jgi:hypothetical protein
MVQISTALSQSHVPRRTRQPQTGGPAVLQQELVMLADQLEGLICVLASSGVSLCNQAREVPFPGHSRRRPELRGSTSVLCR